MNGENSKDLILEHRISEAIASARSAAFEEAAKIVRENDANAVDVEKLILQHAKGDGKYGYGNSSVEILSRDGD